METTMIKSIILSFIVCISSLLSSTPEIYKDRREAVRKQLGPTSVMILSTAKVYLRNGDVEHEFRPDSDFWYLTGHPEQGTKLLLIGKDFKGKEIVPFSDEIIFTRPRNPRLEVWTGKRLGIEGVKQELGFQFVEVTDSFKVSIEKLMPFVDTLYITMSGRTTHIQNLPDPSEGLFDKDKFINVTVISAGTIIHPYRHIKSLDEIKLLQKAINITGEGIISAMQRVKPTLFENNIEATIEFVFRDLGSERLGFPSIIGSGENSTTLHYTSNDRQMKFRDLLLMDVGAEYHMYTADITRTIPVSGRFSYIQREIYSYVLEAQKIAFDSVEIGMTLKDIHKIAKNYLNEKGVGRYFIHGIGHWLGLDVHDVGGRKAKIEVGSVFTIEPGIYIAIDDTTALEKYRGIGIRIEDDVIMTENGPKWLSAHIPKEIDEIETVMRQGGRKVRH